MAKLLWGFQFKGLNVQNLIANSSFCDTGTRLCSILRQPRALSNNPCRSLIDGRKSSTMASKSDSVGLTRKRVESMLKKVDYKIEDISSNTKRLSLPNLSFCTLDAQGQRQMVCYLMKMFDMIVLYWPLPTKDPYENTVTYTLSYEMKIHPSLYDENCKKYPLAVDNTVSYVKRTSRSNMISIRQVDQTIPMVTSYVLDINVDKHTRRPIPYPQWWKDEHSFPEDGPKPEVDVFTKPSSGILNDQRRIHFTDVDENNHTNFTVYIKMCLDMFYENVLQRKYPTSLQCFLNGWIENVKVTFKSETKLGDILSIDSWEDSERQNTYHFEMRHGDQVAVIVSFKLYTSIIANL